MLGLDANSQYLWCFRQPMPTGHLVRRLAETGFARMFGAVGVAPMAGHGIIQRADGKQVAVDMFIATPGVVAGQKQPTVQVMHRAMPH